MIHGYVAGDTFGNRGHSHLATLEGQVVCGTKNRFGMDCSIEVKIHSEAVYETDEWEHSLKHRQNKFVQGHLPLDATVTCKKCLAYIRKKLAEEQKSV